MAALVESRGCPCTDDKEYFGSSHFRNYGLPVLKTLHCVKHILNEEECRRVGKAGLWFQDELSVVIVVKGAVQETLGVLEEYKGDLWYDLAAERIKMLSELYQEKLVTEDEVKRMKGEVGYLSDRVVFVQWCKPPEVVARTVNMLDKYRCNVEASLLRVLSELYQEKLVTEDEVKRMKGEVGHLSARVVFVQCTKHPEVVARTVNMLDKYGHNEEARQLRVLHELFTQHLLTAEECSEVAGQGLWWDDHLNRVLFTKPAEIVQEACQVLEKHDCLVKKELITLNELFTAHLLTAEECSEVARKERWEDHLNQVLLTKPAEVVQEAHQVLEKHGCYVIKELKTLNELFTRHLLTAEECSEVAKKGLWWDDHLHQVLSSKPAEVVQEACQVLEKHGCRVEVKLKMEASMTRRWVHGKHLGLRGDSGYRGSSTASTESGYRGSSTASTDSGYRGSSTLSSDLGYRGSSTASTDSGYRGSSTASTDLGYGGSSTASSDLGYGGSSTVSSDLGYRGSSTVSSDLGYRGSSTASSDLGYSGWSTAATSTHSSSHLVERYQKMSMHSLAEVPCQSQTELSSEEVEEESKHQGSKVPPGSAGEGSGPPREPDSAAVKGSEAALVDLCWIPFGIQSQSVGPEGGKLSLEPSVRAMGGEEGGTILLEVPSGAVSPAESVEVRSGLIPDGPFTLPEGYQLGSMVVYLCYDGHRLTKPCTLSLPHWYGGEDQVRDGLSFAMAPHTLKEGERVYRFELLEGGRFAEQRQCGVLEISGHCTLFAAVFKVKASSLYYASLWTHQVGGAVIADNAMESKVVITYADRVWVEVLEEYWKDWNVNKTIFGGFVKFGFSDNKEQVQGMLSSQFGGGWKASLEANTVCSKDVAYPCRRKRDKENLEWEVCRHIYPPAFSFVVQYNSLPDCSKVASIEQLIVEGTSRGSLRFPFTVYQVKTPHPPTSPSASPSLSMGGCPSLPSPVDTGDEGSETPSSAHPPNGTCQTAPTSKKAQATSTDISQPGASTVDSERDPVLSQKVSDRTDYLKLFRTFVSRNAATKGRAVLEGVELRIETIDACFSSHPLDEEEAVQAGLTRWSGGQGRQPPTWEVLISAMEFAKIAQQHIEDLRKELHASLRAEGTVCTD